jgi:hypothetical protein
MHRNYKSGNMRRKGKFFFLPLMVLALLGFGLVVMLLWNAILPSVTGVEKLSYWQAVGILLLSRILFGGIWPGKKAHHKSPKARMWRNKWMNMSEEERAQFKEEWKHRCEPKDSDTKDVKAD